MLRVYGMSTSGNCHKVRMALEALGRPYAWTEIDSGARRYAHAGVPGDESQRQGAGARNRAGHVPARIERDPVVSRRRDAAVAQRRTAPRARAAVAVLRAVQPRAVHRGGALFAQVSPRSGNAARARRQQDERRLPRARGDGRPPCAAKRFSSAASYSIADFALYAYTHVAGDGGFDLERFPAVRAWLHRVQAQPGYAAMPA